MLYTDKYSPKSIEEIIGNEQAKEKIKRWVLNWRRGKKEKPVLIYGPTGVGKTIYANAVKQQFDMELLEMNASQFRDKANVDRVLAHSLLASTLSGKQKFILVDDADFLCKNDRGGASAIASVIKSSEVPIIITATNPWDKKLAPIRALCDLVQVKRPTKHGIYQLLGEIAGKEQLDIRHDRMMDIAENSNGDVRSAINDLQAEHPTKRDREEDMFNTVRMIFKAQTYEDAKNAMRGNVDYEMVMLWVDENIPYEYGSVEEVAMSYYYMSRADQFAGRITGSSWGYLRYVIDYISAGVALSKKKRYPYFVKYQFPKYLMDMSRSISSRAMRKSAGLKIGGKTHTSAKTAVEFFPIVCSFIKEDGKTAKEFYGFEDDEIEFIEKSCPGIRKKKTKENEPEPKVEKPAKKEKKETREKEGGGPGNKKNDDGKTGVPEKEKGRTEKNSTLFQFI